MLIQRTLSLIKPDSVAKNQIGAILQRFESAGLCIVALQMQQLHAEQARAFYKIHSAQPFFEKLVEFICSGPLLALVLEGPSAISRNREIMGATDPKQALPGSIRADFGDSIDRNAVHGSDSEETAKSEIAFFFEDSQLFCRVL